MLTITLAAVLGLLGVVAVVAYAHQANQRAVNGLKAETVMVAKAAIPAGTSLNEAQDQKLLGTEKVPVSSLSTTAVQSVTAANGQLAVSATVAPNQILLANMLTSAANATPAGSFVVPPGMVAVTVNMCMSEAVADYLAPGSPVAVFDTIAGKGSQIQRSCDAQHQILNANAIEHGGAATLLLLPMAKVLAVGQAPVAQSTSSANAPTATADPSSSSSSAEVLVTLAVSQTDAERLILTEEVGMPYLALLGQGSVMKPAGPVSLFPFQQQQP
jgi:pilus assembly protein CpaB